MANRVLVPVKLSQRRPLHGRRYPIKFYSGMLQAKRFIPNKNEFSRVEEATIDVWYDEVELPTGLDLIMIAREDIPEGTHPEKVKLIMEGMKLLARHYDTILNEKGG